MQINQSEVFRARNRLFNDLLEANDPLEVSARNARKLAYLDRLISRTETATRASHMTADYITKVATKWFWDKETAVTAYGNLHSGMVNAHYNRTFRRATLGEYSMVAVHYQYWSIRNLDISTPKPINTYRWYPYHLIKWYKYFLFIKRTMDPRLPRPLSPPTNVVFRYTDNGTFRPTSQIEPRTKSANLSPTNNAQRLFNPTQNNTKLYYSQSSDRYEDRD